MPANLTDREFQKFVETPAGDTAVRTLIANDSSDPVQVSGGGYAAPTGPLRNSVTTITDTAADPIPVPLANRVSVSVRNKDPVDTVYLGATNTVTADDAATGGWEIGPGEDFNLDLDDSNVFFLIAAAGKTPLVKILEVASTGSGGGGMAGTLVNEVPAGVIDGVNPTFTVANMPLGDDYFALYMSGVRLRLGTHYTRVGAIITMITIPAPPQELDAEYWY